MKVTIRDENILRSIQPHELVSYLRSRAWRQHGTPSTVTAVWRKDSGSDEHEVIVPLERSFRDYASRVLDVLKTLEAIEERSQLDILRDVATSAADIVRIPARRADMRDGSISISARYLEHAKFGQTEHSSYVLTIVSAVPPKLSSHALGERNEDEAEVEEPYERQVTSTLMRSLLHAKSAADRAAATGNLDHFQQAVASSKPVRSPSSARRPGSSARPAPSRNSSCGGTSRTWIDRNPPRKVPSPFVVSWRGASVRSNCASASRSMALPSAPTPREPPYSAWASSGSAGRCLS